MVMSSAEAYSVPTASSVICGDQATRPSHKSESSEVSAGSVGSLGSVGSVTSVARTRLPSPDLCAEHWADYDTDWLLRGWCIDHYGQALTQCPVHHREFEPLYLLSSAADRPGSG